MSCTISFPQTATAFTVPAAALGRLAYEIRAVLQMRIYHPQTIDNLMNLLGVTDQNKPLVATVLEREIRTEDRTLLTWHTLARDTLALCSGGRRRVVLQVV